MTTRSAEFTIVTDLNILHNELNYTNGIVAICVLNKLVEVFTVYKTSIWFRSPQYRLCIKLNSCLTGRELGVKYFNTKEEAIDYGSECIKNLFPVVNTTL